MRVVPLIALGTVIFPAIYAMGSLNGFCWNEMRWLSDDELVDAAIEKYISTMNLSYPNAEYFKRENPHCCSIYLNTSVYAEAWLHWIDCAAGYAYRQAHVTETKFQASTQNQDNPRNLSFDLTTCGYAYSE